MPLLQTPRDRAVALILLLAVAIAVALTPFVSGLLGAGVLYVIFVHPYRWLARLIKPGVAAAIILVVALALVALPLTWLIGLVIAQAPDALHRWAQGVRTRPVNDTAGRPVPDLVPGRVLS